MGWTIQKVIPTFAVPDLEVGIDYYTRLGFAVDWRWPDDDPSHAGLVNGPCSILLSQCEPSDRADVYFIVDDVSACYESVIAGKCWELAAKAGRLANRSDCPPTRSLHAPPAPAEREYGLRDFSIVDPWGHHLAFGTASRAEER